MLAAMSEPLRVAVVGAGSIGCYVGGALAAAGVADVTLIGRARIGEQIAAAGLTLEDLDRPPVTVAADRVRFATEVEAAAGADAVLCCVKSAQTDQVAARLAAVLGPGAAVASLQNGVRNPEVLRGHLPGRPIVAAIVGFNVVSHGGGRFHRGMSGPLSLARVDHPAAARLVAALRAAGLPVEEHADLVPHQWTKLLVNLNNAVSALSDAPTRALLLSPGYRRVVAAVVGEALAVLRTAGVRPARLRGVPVGWMPAVLRLPTALVRLVTRAQMKVDPEARSSMWEDLTRGRPTEVDFLNGEIVRLAAQTGAAAPLNRRIVELVHAAEAAGAGSPALSAPALWDRLHQPAT